MTYRTEKLINVIQGDFHISDDPDAVLSTVLGSCIAVCLCDPLRGVGGMNHFLLPSREGAQGANVRYGAYAMELLINGLLKAGADRARLEAKMFGGASMMGNLRDIGGSNAAFARGFLKDEGIPCRAESVGGTSARRIRYWPTTGQAKQMLITDGTLRIEEKPMQIAMRKAAPAADITLF